MNKKIYVFIVALLMCLTTIVFIPSDLKVEAASGGKGNGVEDIFLDYQYIWNITENLSNVIFDAPQDDGINKGRNFGTTGEHYAAINIIKDTMVNDLNLYNPGLNPLYLDKIENITSKFDQYEPTLNLTNNIEIESFDITINDLDAETNIKATEFYIRPMWNWRLGPATFNYSYSNYDACIDWLENVLNLDTSDCYIFNMLFNTSWLTKNFTGENLKLVKRPTNLSWFFDIIFDNIEDIINNESIIDYSSFMQYIIPEIQNTHNFTFGELTPDNASTNLEWFDEDWSPPPIIGEDEDFLYIGEDPLFN